MAFPGTSKSSLATVWSGIKATTGRIKDKCSQMIAAPSLTRIVILEFGNGLADALQYLTTATATSGLLAYARNEENDPTLDLVAEYTAMRTQIIATQDWLVANFPNDGTGGLSVYTFDVNKRYANINLTAGQLTAFKNQLAALSATIG